MVLGCDRMKYSVGFLFSPDKTMVVLIKKNRPEWEKGLLNGVGGHIEENETPVEAMTREFREETGVMIPCEEWKLLTTLEGKRSTKEEIEEFKVWFFYAISNQFYKVKTVTDEKVIMLQLDDLYWKPTVYNLKWLIPLALDSLIQKPIEFIPKLLDVVE